MRCGLRGAKTVDGPWLAVSREFFNRPTVTTFCARSAYYVVTVLTSDFCSPDFCNSASTNNRTSSLFTSPSPSRSLTSGGTAALVPAA